MGCEQEEDHGKGRRVDRQPTYQELLARVAQLEDRLNQQSLGLQASERRLGFQVRLLANSAEAMTATDEHFMITYWNQAAEDLFGWTAAEAVGRPCADVLAAEVPGSTREAAISRMLEEDGYWGEVTYHRKDGSPVRTE